MNQSYKKWHLNAGGDDEGVLKYQSFVSNNYGATYVFGIISI